MSFTDFYMQTTASNLNAGSTQADSPVYSSTSGSFDGTSVYTPSDGQTTTSLVNVGDWASIFPAANTTTPFVAQVTAVGAGVNGTITVSTTVKFGTAPSSGSSKCRTGGAWADLGMVASGVALATGTVPLSTRINVKAGTYSNGTTARTLALAGSTTLDLWWRGYKTSPGDQDANVTPVAGTDVPLISSTTAQHSLNGNFQLFSSLAWSGATTSGAFIVANGTNIRFYLCSFANTGVSGNPFAFAFNGANQSCVFCVFAATSVAAETVQCASGVTGNTLDGCIVSGGTIGLLVGSNTLLVRDTIFTGQAGDSITVSTGSLIASNVTIYNTNGNGINLTSTGTLYVTSSYFEGMPGGKTAIVNTSGTNSGKATLIANSYFNVGATTSGFGDFPLILDNGVLASSGLASAGTNFTPTSVLYALAFPGKFLSTSTYQSFRDGGAIQHNASPATFVGCPFPG